MDRRLALGALAGTPLFFALLLGLTAVLPPLAGWGVGLVAYWAALGWAAGGAVRRGGLGEALAARPPGRLVTLALAVPVVAMGALALRTLGRAPLPAHLILAAAIAAAATAVLEELFWRGALIPDATERAAAGALGLYAAFHLAWLGARGVETGLPPLLLLGGPLALGGAWTAARLLSGALGAAVLSHAGVKLFLFAQVIALNRWDS